MDPYRSAVAAVAGNVIGGTGIALALCGTAVQGLIAYVSVRWWLNLLARRDHLPAWIYGWATDFANALDNDDTVVIAYVLTTLDRGDKTLAYGGLVHDLAIRPDGSIAWIGLFDCERCLVDLGTRIEDASLSDALSRFTFMTIAGNIRNVAFETIALPQLQSPIGDPTSAP